jgi:hypothetical protein
MMPKIKHISLPTYSYLAVAFLVTACGGGSSTDVQKGNHIPVAANVSSTTTEDVAKVIALLGTDGDSDSLNYTLVTSSTHGMVSLSGNQATYTPAANYHGADSFTYKANDGKADSNTATVSVTVTPVNDAPTANAGADQTVNAKAVVQLVGSGTDVEGDTLSYQWAQTAGTPTVTLTNANTANASFIAPSLVADTPFTVTLTVTDSNGGTATDQVAILVKSAVVQPTPTGKLNDTGITTCSNDTQNGQPCPISTHPNQDADNGRDVTVNDPSDGYAGFSFTKLDQNGIPLDNQSTDYATTPWACVKDNVTGLIWEVKTDDAGLHDKDDTFVWYEPDNTKNGGSAGYQKLSDVDSAANDAICSGYTAGNVATYCNTHAYVARVNAAGWCGAKDWRMPTVNELSDIARFDRYQYPATDAPAIETDFFPNTTSATAPYRKYAAFWSTSPIANNSNYAWNVHFYHGSNSWAFKYRTLQVRLVRSGQ